MVLLALPPTDHLLIERDRRQFAPFLATPRNGQRRCRTLAEAPAEPSPELRIPSAAAQTRVVSMAGIRLGSWQSARLFKGIICLDISGRLRSIEIRATLACQDQDRTAERLFY